ncbi:MAG: undecaprenyl-diphosphate phosphatase [Candidatus Dadabacteria bacterium]|nr:MAG: undecaprenyl-diphosphate phosphatase [Candidatus Dadabacteria bacterium]
MGIGKAIALGVLQGLTEFLPVSSSGHLVLVQHMFPEGVRQALAFDVCLHFGTLLAVVWYFRADLRALALAAAGRSQDARYPVRWVWLLAVATIPAAVVGTLWARRIEAAFGSVLAVGLALLATAGLLWIGSRCLGGRRGPAELGVADAVIVGFFQAAALVPGISRSGSTITGALARGIEPDTAARFAFLMSVPAIAGAMLENLRAVGSLLEADGTAVVAGTLAAAVTGWLAIEVMMRAVRVGRLLPFALYCGGLGIVTLVVGVV